ncbi:hypothetical protein PCASD_14830 [Puccinia coronata f. sp. avenae]|uniref:Uncharacterized protein n=1 Tax=Puccinia coronata f. sp. avenae TaxID=200324 RepID=A0A2N5TCJ0_9BASI|nr:hypothetical protein PCASD_14830 [Puccinia coronata f. sp. avenae]
MVNSIYSAYQEQLTHRLTQYIDSLDRETLNEHTQPTEHIQETVSQLILQLPELPPLAADLKRNIVSSVFSALISHLNHTNSNHDEPYTLYHLLDLALAFIDHGLAVPELALGCIEEILETATVPQAQFIFGYLESRVQKLTMDMLPDRGKGLIFLRMQNNLLRRLSKSLHTVFCGRILCFLSFVFPIAEKSGVNLRGAFNSGNITKFDQFTTFLPTNTDEIERGDSSSSSKDPEKMALQTDAAQMTHPPVNTITAEIKQPVTQIEEIKQPVNPVEEVKKPITPIEEAKQPDDSARAKASKSAADKREFYTRFWSLQGLLSNPPELFKSWTPDLSVPAATTSSDPNAPQPSTPNLKKLKDGISKTLEVFGRMTRKELDLGSTHHHKSEDQDGLEQFFFPKFLTKSNLLDLEIADPYFRRQVLTQFLIILQYIRGFSPEERAKRAALPKSNRISEIPYIYQAKDEAWVLKLSGEVWKTLYATPPHGEIFAMTIQQILIRESSWIMWKAGSCASFEKPSLDVDPSPGYKRITSNPLKFPHSVGTPALSKLWENKVSPESMEKIDPTAGVPDLKTLHLKILHVEQQLEQLQENMPPDTDPKAETLKSQIQQLQERKAGLSWRALRIAQNSYLQFFGKIGMPADVNKLMAMIEEAKNRGGVPLSRPVSGMNASPLTTPNLQLLGGEPPAGTEEDPAEKREEEELGRRTRELHRVPSNDTSQPDVVMLDGESIMESVGGPALTSELDGELISDSQPSAPQHITGVLTDEGQSISPVSRPVSPQPIPSSAAPNPSIRPPPLQRHPSHTHQPSGPAAQQHISPTQAHPFMSQQQSHEGNRVSEVEQVIRRMEAQANRSAVGTPTPPPASSGASGGGGGRHSSGGGGGGEYSRGHQHGGMMYYHPSLPSNPLHHSHNHALRRPPPAPSSANHLINSAASNPSPLLKRPVTDVIDLEAPDLASPNDPKKIKN